MKNLIVITQKVDAQDDHRGSFIGWLAEFAKHFPQVHVITQEKGEYALPGNVFVYSLGKENGASRIARAFRFYRYLMKLLSGSQGIFAHASPIFVIAAWPVAAIYRKRIVLWYLHRSVTVKLKLAMMMSYRVVTAAKESLGITGREIIETGHGIDVQKFKTERTWVQNSVNIISVGRITPIKHYEIVIDALSEAMDGGLGATLKIVGRPVMGGDAEYLASLKRLVVEKRLEQRVQWLGFVPYAHIAEIYAGADYFVGALPVGGIDKAMLEAMAAGCIPLTSNTVFRRYFGPYAERLIFTDVHDLASKLISLHALTVHEKKEMSEYMVNVVREHHDQQKLVGAISNLYV